MSEVRPDLSSSALLEGPLPSAWVITGSGREDLRELVGALPSACLPVDLPLTTLRACLDVDTVLVDLGCDSGRPRRIWAALASGARVVTIGSCATLVSLREQGARLWCADEDSAELRAALLLAEEAEGRGDEALRREIELVDAWLRDEEDLSADGDVRVELGLDPDDRGACRRFLAEMDSAPASALIVGTQREPARPGEGPLETALGDRGFGLLHRARTGAGRRIDLYRRDEDQS